MAVSHFVRSHVRLALLIRQSVKARFTRLVNVGFIKSVSPILSLDLIEKGNILGPQSEHDKGQDKNSENPKGLKIKLDCEFCGGPISAESHVFKFENYERFLCCSGCMSGYKQKYAGRIESIKRKFAGIE